MIGVLSSIPTESNFILLKFFKTLFCTEMWEMPDLCWKPKPRMLLAFLCFSCLLATTVFFLKSIVGKMKPTQYTIRHIETKVPPFLKTFLLTVLHLARWKSFVLLKLTTVLITIARTATIPNITNIPPAQNPVVLSHLPMPKRANKILFLVPILNFWIRWKIQRQDNLFHLSELVFLI